MGTAFFAAPGTDGVPAGMAAPSGGVGANQTAYGGGNTGAGQAAANGPSAWASGATSMAQFMAQNMGPSSATTASASAAPPVKAEICSGGYGSSSDYWTAGQANASSLPPSTVVTPALATQPSMPPTLGSSFSHSASFNGLDALQQAVNGQVGASQAVRASTSEETQLDGNTHLHRQTLGHTYPMQMTSSQGSSEPHMGARQASVSREGTPEVVFAGGSRCRRGWPLGSRWQGLGHLQCNPSAWHSIKAVADTRLQPILMPLQLCLRHPRP